jgi:hypothetical protein
LVAIPGDALLEHDSDTVQFDDVEGIKASIAEHGHARIAIFCREGDETALEVGCDPAYLIGRPLQRLSTLCKGAVKTCRRLQIPVRPESVSFAVVSSFEPEAPKALEAMGHKTLSELISEMNDDDILFITCQLQPVAA